MSGLSVSFWIFLFLFEGVAFYVTRKLYTEYCDGTLEPRYIGQSVCVTVILTMIMVGLVLTRQYDVGLTAAKFSMGIITIYGIYIEWFSPYPKQER